MIDSNVNTQYIFSWTVSAYTYILNIKCTSAGQQVRHSSNDPPGAPVDLRYIKKKPTTNTKILKKKYSQSFYFYIWNSYH